MLEQELQLEKDLFLLFNGCHSAFWDNVMYIYSYYKFTWVPFYLCFFFVIIYRQHWKEIVCVFAAVALLILFCDQLSSGFAKPFFQRLRPTHHPDFKDIVKTVFDYRGGRYGFFSGHAANSFGFATLMALVFRNKIFTVTMFIFAAITAYSRVYMGVHFISDIVVGMLTGIFFGCLFYELFILGRKYWIKIPPKNLRKAVYSTRQAYSLAGVYMLMVVLIFIFNNQMVKLIT